MTLQEAWNTAAERYESFYLYDESCILRHTAALKAAFPDATFLYSIKCNPHRNVVRSIVSQGFGADAASLGEVMLARDAGLARDQIYYSAPGKTAQDIRSALPHAVLVADSIAELLRIQEIAERDGISVQVGVRLNPDFSFAGGCGQPSKFGIDEHPFYDFWAQRPCPNLELTGIHTHLKSQELQPSALARYYRNMLELSRRVQRSTGCDLAYVNLGSGIGIPYAAEDAPLDLTQLRALTEDTFTAFGAEFPKTRIFIEAGRYAAGKSGFYGMRVLDRKVSCGKTYLILKNTLNGFIRPSLARLIGQYADEPAAAEPLFTCKNAFDVLPLAHSPGEEETVTLAGNLCTAADIIAGDISLPRLECGDTVLLTNAGSYAAVLSPMQFSSQEMPAQLFFTADGRLLQDDVPIA